jgi:hypothetical protein
MITDNLSITKIVMLLDQAVVKRFKGGITYQPEFNGWQIRKLSL